MALTPDELAALVAKQRKNGIVPPTDRVGLPLSGTNPPADMMQAMGAGNAPKTPQVNPGTSNTPANGFQAADALKALRAKLDAGQIDVATFLKEGQPLATQTLAFVGAQAGGGAAAANRVNPLISIVEQAGFKHKGGTAGDPLVTPNLPQQYQRELRMASLPDNIPAEARQALVDQIPNDIDINSDEGRLYRQGIIQSYEQKKLAEEQKAQRASGLEDLSKLLVSKNQSLFKQAQPQIAEEANAAGIYTGTGYSEALAREQARLAEQADLTLSGVALSDRSLDTDALAGILATQQGYQAQGLNRSFGKEDYAQQFADALKFADLTKVKAPETSGFDRVLNTVNTGANVAQAATSGKTGKKG